MTTTTEWASWARAEASGYVTLEDSVESAVGDHLTVAETASVSIRYRDAINAALPDGVSLCGDMFIGPYPAPWDALEQLQEMLDDIDFWDIATGSVAIKPQD